MDDNTTPTHCGRRTKRPYDELDPHSQDRSRSTSSPFAFMDPQTPNEGPSNHRSNFITLPPLQRPARRSRDGLDFRRPMRSAESPISFPSTTSTSIIAEMNRRPSVIDLTNEEAPATPNVRPGTFGQASRGPRYAQQIIDLSADSPEASTRPLPAERQNQANIIQSGERSPEVELLSVRPLPEPRGTRPSHPSGVPSTNAEESLDRGGRRRVASGDEEDDLRITEVRQIPGPPPQTPPRRHYQYQFQLMPMMGRMAGAARVRLGFAGAQAGVPAGGGIQFVAPDIDFRIAGFTMGIPDHDIDDHPETPPPPFAPPPSAPEGFTRSPQDGDELICPNCEEELCHGDSDEKKSVWIVKACGHVYCGSCANNRSISKKGRSKTKPFKNCVVAGCGKRTTSKPSMIQIYL